MYEEQKIFLAPRAVAFTAVCDECLGGDQSTESFLAARVSGLLRLDAKRGWATCARGHQIRVERVDGSLAQVIR